MRSLLINRVSIIFWGVHSVKFNTLCVGIVMACVLLASPASARSTTTIVTRVDKPALYTMRPPSEMNLHLVLYLKDGVRVQDFEALRDWLTQEGFRVTAGSAKDQRLEAFGSVDAAESAFRVQILMTPDGKGYGPLEDAEIPAEFGKVVQSIVGLSPVLLAPYRPLRHSQPTPTASKRT